MATMAAQEASALSVTYRLLARLWLGEVDAPLLQQLQAPPLCGAFVEAGGALSDGADEETLQRLATDYCRLILGPSNHLPPYQSVWESGQFQGASSAAMREFIDAVGYDATHLPGGVMLDHLGVQLDVMGYLVGLSTFADAEDPPFADMARTFLIRHLSWAEPLLANARARAGTAFYRDLMQMTGALIHCGM